MPVTPRKSPISGGTFEPAQGVATTVASMIPGIGPIAGVAMGLLPQVASWIIGKDKFDWNKWKEEQQQGINSAFDTSLRRATEQANKTTNATIGQTTNAQGMAGGIAGMSGPGRINAQTYANIAQNRDQAVTGITNGLEQNRASMLSAVEREAAQGSMTEDFNAPTTLTYLDNFMKSMESPLMQEGVGALIGGVGKGASWLGGLLKGKGTTTTTTTNPTVSSMPDRSFTVDPNAPNTSAPVNSAWPITNDGGNIFGQSAIFDPSGKSNWLNKPRFGTLKNLNFIGG